MGTYNSGLNKNGWAYAVSAARRFGEGGYQDGTLYDSNSFFASVEKKLTIVIVLTLPRFIRQIEEEDLLPSLKNKEN